MKKENLRKDNTYNKPKESKNISRPKSTSSKLTKRSSSYWISCFTLLELLIVVAIIGILVSILLPSLANARERGRRAVCLSNQAQIGRAMMSYTQSFNLYFPAPYHIDSTNSESWNDLITEQLGLDWPVSQRLRDKINDTSLSTEVLKCPSDPHDDRFQISYATNLLKFNSNGDIHNNTCGLIGRAQDASNNYLSIMIPRVGVPSETLVTGEFWHENNLAGARQGKTIYQGWFYNMLRQNPETNMNGRALLGHDGQTLQSCLMVDGSAKLMRGWKLVEAAPILGYNHTGTWLDSRDK